MTNSHTYQSPPSLASRQTTEDPYDLEGLWVFFDAQVARIKLQLNPIPAHVSGRRKPDMSEQELAAYLGGL